MVHFTVIKKDITSFDFFVDRFNLNLNLELLDISDRYILYWLDNDKVFYYFQYQFLPSYWISGMRIQYYRMSWNRMVCQLTKSTILMVMKSTWVTTLKVCKKYIVFLLTAYIFESGPMPTPWNFLAGPPVLLSCKWG